MKNLLLTVMTTIISIVASAQSGKQVKWSYSAKKVADKTYEIHMTATIASGWHLYAQEAGDGGPIPTKFTFAKNPLVVFNNKTKEVGKLIKKYDQPFRVILQYYEKTVDFIQTVKVTGNAAVTVVGKIQFMVSKGTETLPPAEIDFAVKVGG